MWDWLSIEWFSLSKFRAFTWVYPYFLYGILAIPILFWLRNAFHAGAFQRLSFTFVRHDPSRSWSVWLRWLFPISAFLSLSCILIALARPQLIRNVTERDAEVIDIMLALDISSSMLEKDLLPNRLAAAQSVAKSFISGRLQDRIGLVVFAGEAVTYCPLTNDYDLLYGFLEEINSKMIATSGTAIGSALAVCINRLRESQTKSKVVILLSDGENTAGNLDPITAAKLAKAFGIKVYTIAVGKFTAAPALKDTLNVALNLGSTDEGTLKTIAKSTNGQFFRAADNSTLRGIFTLIDRLERVKVKNRRFQEVKDYYRIYLNWAISFFLFMLFLKVVFIANVLED
ncbi:vWA domain-containing protein [Runella zeae]|jgi:Ca-activated chloride channel family protein|uniref:vWA domain-containing protein n=1 Tax=Runella zeae TaxID=94255 RepID=UPI00040C0B2E|nr:VWA domain-containing protein [Runella zeae]